MSVGDIFRGVHDATRNARRAGEKCNRRFAREGKKSAALHVAALGFLLSFCGAISCGELSISIYHVVGASAAVAASVPAQITVKSAAVNRVICILGGTIVAGAECRRLAPRLHTLQRAATASDTTFILYCCCVV